MICKGYAARIDYDNDDQVFTGRIAGIRDGVGFHADTVDGLRQAFHEAVEDYLETCAKIGKEPQKHTSGQVMFCVSPAPGKVPWRLNRPAKSESVAEEVLAAPPATDRTPQGSFVHEWLPARRPG